MASPWTSGSRSRSATGLTGINTCALSSSGHVQLRQPARVAVSPRSKTATFSRLPIPARRSQTCLAHTARAARCNAPPMAATATGSSTAATASVVFRPSQCLVERYGDEAYNGRRSFQRTAWHSTTRATATCTIRTNYVTPLTSDKTRLNACDRRSDRPAARPGASSAWRGAGICCRPTSRASGTRKRSTSRKTYHNPGTGKGCRADDGRRVQLRHLQRRLPQVRSTPAFAFLTTPDDNSRLNQACLLQAGRKVLHRDEGRWTLSSTPLASNSTRRSTATTSCSKLRQQACYPRLPRRTTTQELEEAFRGNRDLDLQAQDRKVTPSQRSRSRVIRPGRTGDSPAPSFVLARYAQALGHGLRRRRVHCAEFAEPLQRQAPQPLCVARPPGRSGMIARQPCKLGQRKPVGFPHAPRSAASLHPQACPPPAQS